MLNAAVKSEAPGAEQELTDGFHLVIDALKLNGIDTIYGVPGIPITDLGRMAQAAGIRVLSFRHEQSAGYAASIAGFLTRKPASVSPSRRPASSTASPRSRTPPPTASR
jgi:oxalyl-CoA decarboxylase